MANTKQAKKRIRQAEKARQRNASDRSTLRTYIKKIRHAIEAKDLKAAHTAYKAAVPVIDRFRVKGLIPENTAARYKSRLNKDIKDLSAK